MATLSNRPEINFSRVPLGGDLGGLLVAVGSVILIMLGVPGTAWFLLAAVAGGALLAFGLHRRYRR